MFADAFKIAVDEPQLKKEIEALIDAKLDERLAPDPEPKPSPAPSFFHGLGSTTGTGVLDQIQAPKPRYHFYWARFLEQSHVDAIHAKGDRILNYVGVGPNAHKSGINGTETRREAIDKIVHAVDLLGCDGAAFDEGSLRDERLPSWELVVDVMLEVRAARPDKTYLMFLTGTSGAWATSPKAAKMREAIENDVFDVVAQELYGGFPSLEGVQKIVDTWAESRPDLVPKLIPAYTLGSGWYRSPTPQELDAWMNHVVNDTPGGAWGPDPGQVRGFAFWWGMPSGIADNPDYEDVANKHYGPYF